MSSCSSSFSNMLSACPPPLNGAANHSSKLSLLLKTWQRRWAEGTQHQGEVEVRWAEGHAASG